MSARTAIAIVVGDIPCDDPAIRRQAEDLLDSIWVPTVGEQLED